MKTAIREIEIQHHPANKREIKIPILPGFHKLRTGGVCHVPFDVWTQKDLSQWICRNIPVEKWETVSRAMALQSWAMLRKWPNALQALTWEEIYAVTTFITES